MLLTHPFYRRWEAGELRSRELAEYAVHYRAFEAVLPTVLTAVVERLRADGDAEAADLVARNLADELGSPGPTSSSSTSSPARCPTSRSPAPPGRPPWRWPTPTATLAEQSPAAAIAGLAAYETQAAAIAATKGDGLRRWYGMDAAGTAFWDVHATMDADHGDWVDRGPGPARTPIRPRWPTRARRAADAWWALLDEREAEAAVAA